tara:strand:+ start:28541 stop:29296 length:756 start_codon:yes stop_codon:yes gene_type:complete
MSLGDKVSVDLVIQGPVKENSIFLSKLYEYSEKFDNVIVSHWKGDTFEIEDLPINVTFISRDLPELELKRGVLKDSTFYWALSSTYHGIMKSSSDFIVKMRTDEYYEKIELLLEPLYDSFFQDEDIMVCGNIFHKPWGQYKFHIGDHLFAARRESLLESYKFLVDLYDTGFGLQSSSWANQEIRGNTAESILAKSFLKSIGVEEYLWDSQKVYENFFKVVDINSLGSYTARWVHGHKTFTDSHNPFRIEDF